jgi:hypothetical protein
LTFDLEHITDETAQRPFDKFHKEIPADGKPLRCNFLPNLKLKVNLEMHKVVLKQLKITANSI